MSCKPLVSILHLQFEDIRWLRVPHFSTTFWGNIPAKYPCRLCLLFILAEVFQLPGDKPM